MCGMFISDEDFVTNSGHEDICRRASHQDSTRWKPLVLSFYFYLQKYCWQWNSVQVLQGELRMYVCMCVSMYVCVYVFNRIFQRYQHSMRYSPFFLQRCGYVVVTAEGCNGEFHLRVERKQKSYPYFTFGYSRLSLQTSRVLVDCTIAYQYMKTLTEGALYK